MSDEKNPVEAANVDPGAVLQMVEYLLARRFPNLPLRLHPDSSEATRDGWVRQIAAREACRIEFGKLPIDKVKGLYQAELKKEREKQLEGRRADLVFATKAPYWTVDEGAAYSLGLAPDAVDSRRIGLLPHDLQVEFKRWKELISRACAIWLASRGSDEGISARYVFARARAKLKSSHSMPRLLTRTTH